MPTPIRRAGRGAIRLTGTIIVALLLVLALIQNARQTNTIHELRSFIGEQRNAQVTGCHRGNTLRAQVTANVTVLDEFLATAAVARRLDHRMKVADRYEELRGKLRPIAAVDCERAYPRPPG